MGEWVRVSDELVRVSNGSTDLVVDVSTGAPTIRYWGAPLGDGDVAAIVPALDRPLVAATIDAVAPLSVAPEHGAGFPGRPGLRGRRGGGRDWAPRFVASGHRFVVDALEVDALEVDAVDETAGLALRTTIELGDVLCVRVAVTNVGRRRYSLDALTITVPLPEHADELLTFSGRWAREFHTSRRAWPDGSVSIENRRGRTSHEAPPLLFAGPAGFGEWSGEVWGVHTAWSGNHAMLAERLPDGRRYVQSAELLHPGEIVLDPGESYTTPAVLGVHSTGGLTPATWGFHRSVRAANQLVAARPVLLNTWEAVYFDHDADRLRELADTAAELGIERFVLDDGWFGSRRDDRRGLGEWYVSEEAYPDGLGPLIDHVTGLGMEFGIWVEPEMVNPDSDVYRAHPEWALTTDGYDHVLGRNQLVLDLGDPDAYDYIRDRLLTLLRAYDITFVKWDMNRDHVHGSGADGAAGTDRQTRAVYRLLDELRSEVGGVEFESCASGGARADHEILRRTDRVWTSDCNDALERQTIQRGASMFIPPERMGAHIGPPTSHTTGRTHSLAFRAATAFFGHLGVEWDVTRLDPEERAELATVIELHKEFRALLATGDAVRFDTEPAYCAHGVYAADRSAGLVSFAQLTTAPSLTPPPLRLAGLDAARRYRISHLPLPGERWGMARDQPSWLTGGVELTGAQLAAHGVRPPTLNPESAVVFRLDAV